MSKWQRDVKMQSRYHATVAPPIIWLGSSFSQQMCRFPPKNCNCKQKKSGGFQVALPEDRHHRLAGKHPSISGAKKTQPAARSVASAIVTLHNWEAHHFHELCLPVKATTLSVGVQ
jgi:hypothetical protein